MSLCDDCRDDCPQDETVYECYEHDVITLRELYNMIKEMRNEKTK